MNRARVLLGIVAAGLGLAPCRVTAGRQPSPWRDTAVFLIACPVVILLGSVVAVVAHLLPGPW